MITPDEIKKFTETFDTHCVDVWETLMYMRKEMIEKMKRDGLPQGHDNVETVAEACVLWMINRYHEDHIAMAQAQAFIDELFPHKIDTNGKRDIQP